MDLRLLAVPLLLSAGVAAAICRYALARRLVSGAVPLAIMAASAAWWTVGAASDLFLPNNRPRQVLVATELAAVVVLTAAWLAFAWQFTGRTVYRRLPRGFVGLTAFMAVLMLGLAATNHRHLLVWRLVEINGVLQSRVGIGYWALIGWAYLQFVLGLALLGEHLLKVRSVPVFRAQTLVILGAGLLVVACHLVEEAGLIRNLHGHGAPLGFAGSTLLIWFGLFRVRMLSLVPVAHHVLFQHMRDGLLVVDAQCQLVDVNPAAGHLLPGLGRQRIGEPARQSLGDRPALVRLIEQPVGATETVELPGVGADSWLEARREALQNPDGSPAGFLIILHDVSAQKALEREQRRLNGELIHALAQVRTLTGLLPICSGCKMIRDDQGAWQPLERYLCAHTDAQLTHGLCPGCITRYFPGV